MSSLKRYLNYNLECRQQNWYNRGCPNIIVYNVSVSAFETTIGWDFIPFEGDDCHSYSPIKLIEVDKQLIDKDYRLAYNDLIDRLKEIYNAK